MQAINDKVNQLASWKHAHIADYANLKLSLDQHIQRYDRYIFYCKDHYKELAGSQKQYL